MQDNQYFLFSCEAQKLSHWGNDRTFPTEQFSNINFFFHFAERINGEHAYSKIVLLVNNLYLNKYSYLNLLTIVESKV